MSGLPSQVSSGPWSGPGLIATLGEYMAQAARRGPMVMIMMMAAGFYLRPGVFR